MDAVPLLPPDHPDQATMSFGDHLEELRRRVILALIAPLPDGAREIVAHLDAVEFGRWDVTLSVDGAEVGAEEGFTMLFPMAPFQGIDVGISRRSPVSWELFEREGCFPYTGTLHHVRYEPGEPCPNSPLEMVEALREIALTYD
jgi:hypothetical protein